MIFIKLMKLLITMAGINSRFTSVSKGMPKYLLPYNDTVVLNEVLKNFSPNKKKMLELANIGYITATDLADYLVKNHGMSFRKAYQVTASIINYAEKKKKRLDELNINELNKIEPKLTKDVLKIFDLEYSVRSKKSYGGTSFDNIKKMITKHKKN